MYKSLFALLTLSLASTNTFADPHMDRQCKLDRAVAIVRFIVIRCRADAEEAAATGRQLQPNEEEICEATAWTNARAKAAAECAPLSNPPNRSD